ncbi:MAG: bifunctional allantoicase/(S)-ureidoglycine aminohydrolase [Tabrizicola sp.]|uniref:bifunctional allantoicase/(S)-ureidoglycine aminohydrolase n=1 Tax=Tabrizicola sp. TaxID=2005166 RepID=UPI002734D96A|nr:bifunctional allantoicase/(S)-ureidoglycine aminohydrolase [Tabrizicola sp.]MDP3263496.1 bifunctional allantoicase/(S)-ureidoglycine aminohydrolase [Tabrizicola sp.]MDP3649687.1 bifunctional allantoicase/(S)-ureidoglycine aminohydrolase [Paracoccaceae bacterium]
MTSAYHYPTGGLPPQTQLMTARAVFTTAYAFIPKGCFSDIVTSYLPGWTKTKLWLIARPLTGFSETFSQYVMEVAPGGGSDTPDAEPGAEHWLFFTDGLATLTIGGDGYEMDAGAYAYIPAGTPWALHAEGATPARFHWLRKLYEPAPGVPLPDRIVINERDLPPIAMPDTGGAWATTRFADPTDLRHDAHVNIVTLQPGARIPFEETHVMEHGLFVLEGRAAYKLNQDWVEVEAGDFMWLRAYCPQACIAAGPGPFRYLLYKDVNRHARLRGPGAFGPPR